MLTAIGIFKGIFMKKRRIPKEILTDLYLMKKMTTLEICKKLSVGNSVICREMKRHGITPRIPGKKHGMSATRPYKIWLQMKNRCSNPKNSRYYRYGAKGILYCSEWENFESFWFDMGPTYKEGLTIDRIDGTKNYDPENCRWADYSTQNNNRSSCLSWDTSAKDVAQKANISITRVYVKKRLGWSDKKIIEFYKKK
jgi:hypothetical protein